MVAIPVAYGAALTVVFLIGGYWVYRQVTGSYLQSGNGKKLINNAKQSIYRGTTYLANQFRKGVRWTGEMVKVGFQKMDAACKDVLRWIDRKSKKPKEKSKGKSGSAKAKSGSKGDSDAKKDGRTAGEIIGEEKKGAINREFPEEWRDSTIDEIERAAKQGDKSAQKAKKLLKDKRFDKTDNRK